MEAVSWLLLSPPPGHSGLPGHLTDAATAPLVSRLPLCSYSRWNLIKYEQNLLRPAPGGHHTQSQDTTPATPANTSLQITTRITTENRDFKHIIKVLIKEDVDMFAFVLSRSSHYGSNIQHNGSIWEMREIIFKSKRFLRATGGRTKMDWGLSGNWSRTQEFENGIILDVPNRRQLSFWRSSQSQLLTAAAQVESEEREWSVTFQSPHHPLESLDWNWCLI